jgi:hypothetical protein
MTLVELFAYLTEMSLYRLNRVSDANAGEFLKLINGPGWGREGDLGAATKSTLRALAEIHRAVTPGDFEQLALAVNESVAAGTGRIVRVSSIPGRNLAAEWDGFVEPDASADVSVVVLAEPESAGPELLRKVRHVLDKARLLCTSVHVLAPRYVTVGVSTRLAIRRNCPAESVHKNALGALVRFFDALAGGPDGGGWPFGRDIYVSELYQLLAQLDGVEEVREIVVTPAEPARVLRNRLQEVEAIDLGPGELVKAQIEAGGVVIEQTEKYANRR